MRILFSLLLSFSLIQTASAEFTWRKMGDTAEDLREMYSFKGALKADRGENPERLRHITSTHLPETFDEFQLQKVAQSRLFKTLPRKSLEIGKIDFHFLYFLVNEFAGYYFLYASDEDQGAGNPVGLVHFDSMIDNGLVEESIVCLSTAPKGMGQWALEELCPIIKPLEGETLNFIKTEKETNTLTPLQATPLYLFANIEADNLPSLISHWRAGFRPLMQLEDKGKRGICLVYPPLNPDSYGSLYPEAATIIRPQWKRLNRRLTLLIDQFVNADGATRITLAPTVMDAIKNGTGSKRRMTFTSISEDEKQT